VNLKAVLHSSQCFFCECDNHSIKQSWWTYLILPLHLHGWKRGSVSLPSPLHIRQVSASPIPSSPSAVLVAYCGSFMRSGGGSSIAGPGSKRSSIVVSIGQARQASSRNEGFRSGDRFEQRQSLTSYDVEEPSGDSATAQA